MDITETLSGIVVLDKPPLLTSAACLNRIKRLVPRSCKVGHAGTLDALATGVLVVLLGKATRACERIMGMPKSYDATIKLGATTETDDAGAPEVVHRNAEIAVSEDQLSHAISRFVGTVSQMPPRYSALKLGGRRASDFARRGKVPPLVARDVHIDAIRILEYRYPLVRIQVDCGRGTYIRALARDLGQALDRGGYLTSLRRTRVGCFNITQSVSLDKLVETGVEPHLRALPSEASSGPPGH